MKHVLTLLIISLLSVSCMAEEQEIAPDFTLEKLSGGNFTLSEHQGKVVFIFIFGNTCSSCLGIGSSVQSQLVDAFAANSNFIAIGIDDWDGNANSVNNFKDRTELTIPLLLKGSSVVNQLGSRYDRLLVINAQGEFEFKGSQLASSDLNSAKSAIQTALNNVATTSQRIESNSTALAQNYPNPFSGLTTIQFKLDHTQQVSLNIFDLSGKLVNQLVNRQLNEGDYQINFDRENLPSGTYMYQLNIDGVRNTKRMTIL